MMAIIISGLRVISGLAAAIVMVAGSAHAQASLAFHPTSDQPVSIITGIEAETYALPTDPYHLHDQISFEPQLRFMEARAARQHERQMAEIATFMSNPDLPGGNVHTKYNAAVGIETAARVLGTTLAETVRTVTDYSSECIESVGRWEFCPE